MKDTSRIAVALALTVLFLVAFSIDFRVLPNFHLDSGMKWLLFGFVIWLCMGRGGCCRARCAMAPHAPHADKDGS